MTVNRFDAPLAQLEVELEKARVKRKAIREAQDAHLPQSNSSTLEVNRYVKLTWK